MFSCMANLPFSDRLEVCDDRLNASCGQLPTTPASLPGAVTTRVVVTDVFKEVVAVQHHSDDDQDPETDVDDSQDEAITMTETTAGGQNERHLR